MTNEHGNGTVLKLILGGLFAVCMAVIGYVANEMQGSIEALRDELMSVRTQCYELRTDLGVIRRGELARDREMAELQARVDRLRDFLLAHQKEGHGRSGESD
jgi:hypothetical protein